MVDNKTIDSRSYEGFIMDSYISKNQLKPTFFHKDNDYYAVEDRDVEV